MYGRDYSGCRLRSSLYPGAIGELLQVLEGGSDTAWPGLEGRQLPGEGQRDRSCVAVGQGGGRDGNNDTRLLLRQQVLRSGGEGQGWQIPATRC